MERLSIVRGIGRWSAQMFLVFQLNRPDVWPTGDLGLGLGYGRIHGLAGGQNPFGLLGEHPGA